MKNILIAGTHSYIGDSFKSYLAQYPDEYVVNELDTIGLNPTPEHFRGVDHVFCVAGIAHIKETEENRGLYYKVNRDLVIDLARNAKAAGVQQFILLSTMAVYGLNVGHITKETEPQPTTAYGDAKYQADLEIESLSDASFRFVCLRPPMVYGKGCKGNYQRLRQFALRFPLFPEYKNERSMVYIGNLCEFVKKCIDSNKSGLFFPQNAEYVNTSEMVRCIAEMHEKRIATFRGLNWTIKLIPLDVVRKVFGNLTYERTDTINKYSFKESIHLTEG